MPIIGILEHFLLALSVFQIFEPQIVWPWKGRSRSRRTTFAMAPYHGQYIIFYLTAIVMFALSVNIFEIFATQIKCQKVLPWKWRSRSRKRKLDLRHSTGIIRLYISDMWFFFRILATWQRTFTQKGAHTHTHFAHAHTHSERQGDDYRQNLQRRYA